MPYLYLLMSSADPTEDDLEELPGVGPATAESLAESGFNSYEGIAAAQPSELENLGGVGESTAWEIIEVCQDKTGLGQFETGMDVKERRKGMLDITFLVDDLDDLLGGGGIETQAITEFAGQNSSGKSQVAYQFCVNTQLPEEYGGLSNSVIFIDTEDTFRPGRVGDMVRGLPDEIIEACMERDDIEGGVDDEDALEELVDNFLDQVHIAKSMNSSHQTVLGQKAKDIASDKKGTDWPVGMIIVDSLTAQFRGDYTGRGELADRQQKLNKHMHDLKKASEHANAAIIVTNQAASNPDSYFGNPNSAIGGNIVGHNSTHRFWIKDSKGDKRIFRLKDSPDNEEAEAPAEITEGGWKDA